MSCLFVGMTTAEQQPLAQEVTRRPNILFILTDDQDPKSLRKMANVQSLLVDRGTSFTNAFTTTSLCCPSRVSFMRGQYVHNHGVLTNAEPEGGYDGFIELGLQDSTIATWLDDAGYSTFYAGKFLNGYKKDIQYVPPGWDRWFAFAGAVDQQYTVNENGELRTYTQAKKHETYYLRDRTEAFIRNRTQSSAPWFAWVSTHAPHGPHTIAPKFQGSYDGVEMPRPPSYNEADVSDKPAWVQALPRLDSDCSTDEGKLDCHQEVSREWRARQESLMSVDVMIKDLINALAETNQLVNTYFIFASDNGYLLYRHRHYSKGPAYEESAGVPFVVRGPGVRQGVVSKRLTANIDLAPTIAAWAGVQVPDYVDGRSLVPLLKGTATSWRKRLLLELEWGERSYAGVRTAYGETYVEYESGEKEYYDLATDRWQLDSAHSAPENAQRIGELSTFLSELKSCARASCRSADGGP
jgi:arylsulfatase A-like enzyme